MHIYDREPKYILDAIKVCMSNLEREFKTFAECDILDKTNNIHMLKLYITELYIRISELIVFNPEFKVPEIFNPNIDKNFLTYLTQRVNKERENFSGLTEEDETTFNYLKKTFLAMRKAHIIDQKQQIIKKQQLEKLYKRVM